MEKRTQFTFYESFFTALARIENDVERAAAYDAICKYALYGIEPDTDALPTNAAIAFILIKPNLDASRKKAMAGKAGGRPRKKSKSKAEQKQTESTEKSTESENKEEIEIEEEIETKNKDECQGVTAPQGNRRTPAEEYYLNRINPTPSEMTMRELLEFERQMGSDMVIRACQIALDERISRGVWNYIRKILNDKKRAGIKTLAQWDAAERERAERKARSGEHHHGNAEGEYRYNPGDTSDSL